MPLLAVLTGIAGAATTAGVAGLSSGVAVRFGWLSNSSNPVVAVASTFIDLSPAGLKDWAISTFGVHDKTVLAVGMVLVLIVISAVIGVVGAPQLWGGRVRPRLAGLLLLVIGGLGVAAVLTRADARPGSATPTLIGLAAGALVLTWLWGQTPAARAEPVASSRRRVLGLAMTFTALGVVTAVTGQVLGSARARVDQMRVAIQQRLRPPVVPAGAQGEAPQSTPFLTPNAQFYRIDTAFVPPAVDPNTWRLRITGMVKREVELSLDDLFIRPMHEAMITLACVSNEVGGDLVGNAVWTGWPVRDLLALAEPRTGADMVLSRSVDGFTASTPLDALTDDREAMLAIGMNGEPLSVTHGFPARLVVPGLYGYVSATKWVTELKVTRFADDLAYWTQHGWSDRAPIKTASRFDVPKWGAKLPAGPTVLAGVAWAQGRGIDNVEVSIDWEPWKSATLAAQPTIDAWQQWWLPWEATPGEHTLMVRATDGTGDVQDVTVRRPDPDGATGHHTIKIVVE